MKTSIAFALAAAQLVASHTTFQSMIVDGKDQGQHTAVRTPSNGNNPILDVSSTAMICNGGAAAADTVDVKAGSEITFQWHHNDPATVQGDQDEPIAASHKGPIMVYVAPAESNGEGDVWVKIAEEGLTGGKWAVENFIANKGKHSITLPDLADGEYLIRPELIALHEGNRAKGAQFYNGCGQIKVSGGKTALPAGVDMTKAYSATDKGVLFDMYSGATTYEIPGPKVWDGASSGSAPAPAPVASAKPTPTSAAPSAVPTPEETATPAPTSAPAPTAAPQPGSGSALPEQFTIAEFIAWLKQTTGTKARRHARDF